MPPTRAGIFQTVGAGAHYLVNGSTNRNMGTTNINAELLAGLRMKTTYPPVVLSNSIGVDTTFSPQAPRDTDSLDLGSQQGGLMGYSMRTDRYRFTQWSDRHDNSKVDSGELYDHQTDPQENQNLASRPENAALVKELTAKLAAGWKAALP